MEQYFLTIDVLLWQETYFEEDMKRVAVPLRETEAVKVCSYYYFFAYMYCISYFF